MSPSRAPHLFGMISTAQSLSYTTSAIESLLQFTPLRHDDAIVLVDNDNSAADLAALRHPQIRRFVPPHPQGFAENANRLISEAVNSRKDLILLNNDLIFAPDWSETLAECGNTIAIPATNREVQYALALAIPQADAEPQLFTLSMTMEQSALAGRSYAFQAMAEFHRARKLPHRKLLILPFACVRIPLRIMQTIGGFDATFGRGGAEDYDYCLRAHLAGFEVTFAATSLILHFGGRSSWGVERTEEQNAREELFRRRFREKWGEALYAMVLLEKDVTSGDLELSSLHHPEHIPALIRELLRREGIAEPPLFISATV